MVDKVKPMKIENSATGGTENDPFPRGTDPNEDYLACKGIAFENLDTHLIDRVGNDIQLTDPTIGTKTIDSLQSNVRVSSNDTTPDNLLSKITGGAAVTVTEKNDGADESLEIKLTNNLAGQIQTYAIGNNTAPFIKVSAASYLLVRQFVFKGSNTVGVPTNIKVIAGSEIVDKGFDIRIFDSTNANVLAEMLNITTIGMIIRDMGTLSSIPTGESIFEIHMRKNVSSGGTGKIASLEVFY